jgi:D-tyrosyl-tRNA(Tyr) deacylase
MRAIIQRVLSSSVTIDGSIFSSIEHGLLVLLGVTEEDSEDDVVYLVNKIAQMRIFGDAEGKMNLSVMDIEGEVMVISQFTLFAQTKKATDHHLY